MLAEPPDGPLQVQIPPYGGCGMILVSFLVTGSEVEVISFFLQISGPLHAEHRSFGYGLNASKI